jgi:hypothetical protein
MPRPGIEVAGYSVTMRSVVAGWAPTVIANSPAARARREEFVIKEIRGANLGMSFSTSDEDGSYRRHDASDTDQGGHQRIPPGRTVIGLGPGLEAIQPPMRITRSHMARQVTPVICISARVKCGLGTFQSFFTLLRVVR